MKLTADICRDLNASLSREWLVANGLGGYACGTVAGANTRRYHGLLVAATEPPVGRTMLLQRVDETISVGGVDYELATNCWASGAISPQGYDLLDSFSLELGLPVWRFNVGHARLEKRLWMVHGRNVLGIRYTLRGDTSVRLALRFLVNNRVHHAVSAAGSFGVSARVGDHGATISLLPHSLHVRAGRGRFLPEFAWYRDYLLPVERDRGYDHIDNACLALSYSVELSPGQSIDLHVSSEPLVDSTELALEAEHDRRRRLLEKAKLRAPDSLQTSLGIPETLVLSADSFIVKREEGSSVIAGYPWFADWGRDTMIAFPGLFLSTGRLDEGAKVLRTFARHVREGLVPNRFGDESGEPEYNTIDASLWFIQAVDSYCRAAGSRDLAQELLPALMSIVEHHRRGTHFGIGVDPEDGLLRGGAPGLQLTWMDARIGDWVVTPRRGKPVEINALWHSGLRILAELHESLALDDHDLVREADRAKRSFARFWNEDAGCCFDVLDSPDVEGGSDASLRPNQLLAVSLPQSPLSTPQKRSIVDLAMKRLLVPCGVRTLDPADPRYVGRYEGDQRSRDAAYHQGTAWPWLLGALADAHRAAYGSDPPRAWLADMLNCHLVEAGLGSVSEVLDGDPTFRPGGCPWQAWSVAEALRILKPPM